MTSYPSTHPLHNMSNTRIIEKSELVVSEINDSIGERQAPFYIEDLLCLVHQRDVFMRRAFRKTDAEEKAASLDSKLKASHAGLESVASEHAREIDRMRSEYDDLATKFDESQEWGRGLAIKLSQAINELKKERERSLLSHIWPWGRKEAMND